jgi:transketolase
VDPQHPTDPHRDRFILSKGHAAAALYAVLAERGFFPKSWLETYGQNRSRLAGHVTRHGVPGVEFSTGSLGHGLSLGCGVALAAKRSGQSFHCFVLVGDGECEEGSIWEAAMFAAHHALDNLVVIVDHNRWQGLGTVDDVLSLGDLAGKWSAFGWQAKQVDGHDHLALDRELMASLEGRGRPTAIVADTVKGKGVSFMEDELIWHYKSPDDAQLEQALREVSA